MKNKTFEELLNINCFSENGMEQREAAELLEKHYCCEIHCPDMDKSVLFAHHARGCTIVAAKLCKGVVIYQNVTLGSNMKYDKLKQEWQNVGSPILDENVIVSDGAKILGPVVIGKNTVVGAGAIITIDIPENSVAYGVNQYKLKNPDFDLVFNSNMISGEEIMKIDRQRVIDFDKSKQ
ncbi:LbetaH domain-containing protein [Hespellia stercorisuis]|uniref:Serine O-acetyltransferase n=1 Tax=Hespellia stercorisuis DSM 15480 TaxID=1121950 RepID=A0A1M6UZG9_9FIRM|nr:serine acetyltransferase [Hespellia stercorisuis]SHK74657.1 serine O-acetyltransferase [Hespellia stercorisuis DSM 15480]